MLAGPEGGARTQGQLVHRPCCTEDHDGLWLVHQVTFLTFLFFLRTQKSRNSGWSKTKSSSIGYSPIGRLTWSTTCNVCICLFQHLSLSFSPSISPSLSPSVSPFSLAFIYFSLCFISLFPSLSFTPLLASLPMFSFLLNLFISLFLPVRLLIFPFLLSIFLTRSLLSLSRFCYFFLFISFSHFCFSLFSLFLLTVFYFSCPLSFSLPFLLPSPFTLFSLFLSFIFCSCKFLHCVLSFSVGKTEVSCASSMTN